MAPALIPIPMLKSNRSKVKRKCQCAKASKFPHYKDRMGDLQAEEESTQVWHSYNTLLTGDKSASQHHPFGTGSKVHEITWRQKYAHGLKAWVC